MKTRIFRATSLQENTLPWFQESNGEWVPATWGVTLVPLQVFADGDTTEPLYYEWQSELPEGTELPDWIEEVLPPVVDPVEEQPTV